MLSKSRGPYVSVLQSPAVFTKAMVQGPTCLANVGAGAFSTWDAVHHTFPAIGWYWVLYRRQWLLTPTTTPRPAACWSPGTSSTTSPPSTGRRAPCQDSMPHYCPDRASIWPNPIFVLLLLLIFPFLPLFSFIFIYVLLITLY